MRWPRWSWPPPPLPAPPPRQAPADPTGAFLLRDGRFVPLGRPGAAMAAHLNLNNRGQIVGVAVNPEDPASPPPTDTAPMGRMA
jgi:hypothetical protein